MDASARASQLAYLEKRIERLAEEANMHDERRQHEEASRTRCVQQCLAEMHSMLRATAPGEWAHIQETGLGGVPVPETPVDPGNAQVDGDDAYSLQRLRDEGMNV